MTVLLETEDLTVRYGRIEAVRHLSLQVHAGEVVALLGANGAGKSTTLRCISGLLRPAAGDVRFAGRSIARLTAPQIVAAGMAHAPEGHRIFPDMTVHENLLLGAYLFPAARSDPTHLQEAYDRFPLLGQRRDRSAGTLSGGERQMLGLARALMSRPRVLLLDEPSLGLAPLLVRRVGEMIAELVRERQLTVLLAEQNASLALRVASRAYVLELGEVVHAGDSESLRQSPKVRRAYLGVS